MLLASSVVSEEARNMINETSELNKTVLMNAKLVLDITYPRFCAEVGLSLIFRRLNRTN